MYIPMWVIVLAWCLYNHIKKQDENNVKSWNRRKTEE